MSNQEVINQEEKPSLVWSLIKKFMLALFPGIRLLKINQGLKRVNKFYKHEWFDKQRKRNLLVSILVSLPFLLALAFCSLVILKAEVFMGNIGYAQKALFSLEISKFLNMFKKLLVTKIL